ncbi:MAG: ATP-binding protein [Muribaculaceae bacterium]|nr:ATP-binding protein [Muribaculaceae bacterium]
MGTKSFIFGTAVSDYNFIGREKETRRLIANFNGGINTILISPRRIGKTSLVKHAIKQIEGQEDLIVVYLDMFACKTEYEFYNALSAAVLKQTASRAEMWMEYAREFITRLTPKIAFSPEANSEFSLSLGISPKTHTPEEVLSLAENIAAKRNKRIVICIDEFQQIGELPDSITVQKRLRSVWQHQQLTSYCLFGSKKHMMTNIFQRRNMPFYQFGDMIYLGKIDAGQWVKYITSHFTDGKRHISPELAGKLCDTVDNYSSYVQQLAWLLFSSLNEGESANETQLDRATEDLLDTNEALFMQQIEPLTSYQLNFLRAIADGHHSGLGEADIREEYALGSPSNITRLKAALVGKDLIEMRDRGAIHITDPVFRLWLQRRL